MAAPSVRTVAERLKSLLPPDGTPVLNRVLKLVRDALEGSLS
jgi:hypothetical protein